MTPADLREWWLALGAIGASLTVGAAQAQTPPEKAGIVSGVVPGAKGSNQTSGDQVIVIGNDIHRQERITTDANGTVHLLFLDQSSITLGPNSDIVIDRFVFDPDTGKGNLAISTTKGILRVVGGKLSKQADTVVNTPLATIGIRGGITTIETRPNGDYNSTFLFGQHMNVQGQDGQTRNVTRPGFGVSSNNGQTGPIQRTNVDQLNSQLGRLGTNTTAQARSSSTPNNNNTQPNSSANTQSGGGGGSKSDTASSNAGSENSTSSPATSTTTTNTTSTTTSGNGLGGSLGGSGGGQPTLISTGNLGSGNIATSLAPDRIQSTNLQVQSTSVNSVRDTTNLTQQTLGTTQPANTSS